MKVHSRFMLLLGLLTMVLSDASAVADVSTPAVIGSHMVLQREMPLPIWGWATPGEEVSVTLGDQKASTKANPDGKWSVTLPAMKSGGGPLELTIAGKNTLKYTDILIGEVWLCSGQSNMQMSVGGSQNAQEEVSGATFPKIRLFSVPLIPSGTPASDVAASWSECSPTTAPGFSAVAYFFGREIHETLDVPVGLIHSSWGGTRIEPWIPPVGFETQKELSKQSEAVQAQRAAYQKVLKSQLAVLRPWIDSAEKAAAGGTEIPEPPTFPPHPLNSNGAPTGLYNGMIHPVVPFAIRGALWYQGESNVGQGMEYFSLMKGLIHGWRTVWKQGDFPFYYVHIAPYKYGGKETALPELWEAQNATLAVPNTGMAVITDVGNVSDIHPANKQAVGHRLALCALAKTYGKTDLEFSGPMYDSMAVELDQVRLKFKHAAGLKARDGKALSWFTVAGEDKKFYPAQATLDGDSVLVGSSKVTNPVAVRFGWHQTAEPNLMNKAGLPAAPFRTDSWSDAIPAFPDK